MSIIYLTFMIDSDEDDDDDDDDDDEAELQAELQRIKNERLAAQTKKEEEERLIQQRQKTDDAMKSNPLVNNEGSDSAKVSSIEFI